MDSKALFVGIEADAERGAEVADFLCATIEPVEREREASDWFAIRFSDAQFAIFDTFPGQVARLKYLLGSASRALIAKTFTILDGLPEIRLINVLAAKPLAGRMPSCCLHLRFDARAGKEGLVERFLVSARPAAVSEPRTLAWYAARLGDGAFGIIVFFADAAGREAYLAGEIMTALNARAEDLLAAAPELTRGDVLASKSGG
jgi:hypothetical protein